MTAIIMKTVKIPQYSVKFVNLNPLYSSCYISLYRVDYILILVLKSNRTLIVSIHLDVLPFGIVVTHVVRNNFLLYTFSTGLSTGDVPRLDKIHIKHYCYSGQLNSIITFNTQNRHANCWYCRICFYFSNKYCLCGCTF